MKVWLLTTMPYPYRQWEIPFPLPGYMFDRRLGKDLCEGYLALYRRADELGFDGICVAEHHSGKTGIDPSPNLMASVLAKQTKQARIVVMGNCLPLHGHPIRLAEELDRHRRKHGGEHRVGSKTACIHDDGLLHNRATCRDHGLLSQVR